MSEEAIEVEDEQQESDRSRRMDEDARAIGAIKRILNDLNIKSRRAVTAYLRIYYEEDPA